MIQIIKTKDTGRDWGDKKDDVLFKTTIDGVKYNSKSYDSWEGPVEAGQRGQYVRYTIHTKEGF